MTTPITFRELPPLTFQQTFPGDLPEDYATQSQNSPSSEGGMGLVLVKKTSAEVYGLFNFIFTPSSSVQEIYWALMPLFTSNKSENVEVNKKNFAYSGTQSRPSQSAKKTCHIALYGVKHPELDVKIKAILEHLIHNDGVAIDSAEDHFFPADKKFFAINNTHYRNPTYFYCRY